jgi:DNA-binding MarR family transcriptional regulator
MAIARQAEGPAGLSRCTGYVFGRAGLLLLDAVEEALVPHDLQMRHVAVMLLLSEAERPMSQQEMSTVLNLDPTRMVAIIDELERVDYVGRRRNPEDRRRYMVSLTIPGAKALEKAMEVVDAAEDRFFEPLSAKERSHLGDVARQLMAPHWAASPEP